MNSSLSILIKWLLGFLVFWKIPISHNGAFQHRPRPAVSVIIPARDEEKNLPGVLHTLRMQSVKPHEVIVVDDNSSDSTSAVARQWGATVVIPGPVPRGWTGKTWACWKGARSSTAELLLFLDADTRLDKDSLGRMIDEFARQKRGLLSWYPYHTMEKAYERLSAFFNLVSMMALGIATVFGRRFKPLGAYGACMLCHRDDYFATGGHKAVKGEIMEDVALGRLFRLQGVPLNCLAGQGTVTFRMYPQGISQLIEGWSKNFASGAKTSRFFPLLIVVVWITGALQAAFAPAQALFSAGTDQIGFAFLPYAAYVLQLHLMLRRLGNYGVLTSLCFPVPLLFFVAVFMYSLVITFLARTVRWRGRSISLRKSMGRV